MNNKNNAVLRWTENSPAEEQLKYLVDIDKIDSTTKASQIKASTDREFETLKLYSNDVITSHLKKFFAERAMNDWCIFRKNQIRDVQ